MTIVGDKKYLEEKEFDILDDTYFTKDNSFSGFVFYHSTEREFVNGWRYASGKVIHKVNVSSKNDIQLRTKSA